MRELLQPAELCFHGDHKGSRDGMVPTEKLETRETVRGGRSQRSDSTDESSHFRWLRFVDLESLVAPHLSTQSPKHLETCLKAACRPPFTQKIPPSILNVLCSNCRALLLRPRFMDPAFAADDTHCNSKVVALLNSTLACLKPCFL